MTNTQAHSMTGGATKRDDGELARYLGAWAERMAAEAPDTRHELEQWADEAEEEF